MFCGRWQRRTIVEHDAATQCVDRLVGDLSVHLHEVGLGFFVPRVGQRVRQPTVVGQQQQTFAVVIEPSGRK